MDSSLFLVKEIANSNLNFNLIQVNPFKLVKSPKTQTLESILPWFLESLLAPLNYFIIFGNYLNNLGGKSNLVKLEV